jgi:signal transduction histidine kinase
MAKETAHQLGTPISAILAWIEHLKEILGDDPDQQEIITELTKDVNRLDLVADRFSKIGSAPKLVEIDLYAQLDECKEYMEKRASRKIVFDFDKGSGKNVMINEHLFNWVIENLIRNALDAMGGTGKISTIVYEENNYFCLDLTDTGKGIAPSKFKTIFQPGYSTKSRGWGLGLSLAKRIIENYHSGKIYVKNSTPNQETTFTIKLPKATK